MRVAMQMTRLFKLNFSKTRRLCGRVKVTPAASSGKPGKFLCPEFQIPHEPPRSIDFAQLVLQQNYTNSTSGLFHHERLRDQHVLELGLALCLDPCMDAI